MRQPPVIAGRVPPHDLDMEAAVLSACMLDRAALDRAGGILTGRDFYSESNGLIFDACLWLVDAGSPADIVTVGGRLRALGQLERCGGAAYLGQLVDATPAVANVDTHAQRVASLSRLRGVIAACQRLA